MYILVLSSLYLISIGVLPDVKCNGKHGWDLNIYQDCIKLQTMVIQTIYF